MNGARLLSCRLLLLTASILFSSSTCGLEVTPNSECSSLCVDNIGFNPNNTRSSSTQEWDLICNDYELDGPNQTIHGRKWKDCISCESTSTATDSESKENEVYWLLFNMKFTIDWCVFDYPENNRTAANTQCAEICGGPDNSAKSALTDRLLQTNATIQYQYCEDGNGAFSKIAQACMDCLDKVPNSKTLKNYVNAMNVACQQKPDPGELLKLNFDLFPPASTPTSISPSGPTVTVTSPASSFSSAGASATSSPTSVPASGSHSNNVGIGVGVGIGIGAIAIISAIAAFVFLRRRSDRKREQSEEDARARWEAEYQARLNQKQSQDYRIHELGAPQYVAEADNGQPHDIPMLESPEYSRSPETLKSSGTLGSSIPSSVGSPKPRGSGTQRSFGMPHLFGKPPVPEKDAVRRDSAG